MSLAQIKIFYYPKNKEFYLAQSDKIGGPIISKLGEHKYNYVVYDNILPQYFILGSYSYIMALIHLK
ncbi:MAG: hypothetical protein Aureis2KO_17330 [Aureisphaera sp.]